MTAIVRRTRHRVPATGEKLLHIAKQDLRALESFREKCAHQPATVRITAGNSVIHWLLGPRLADLGKRLPEMKFELRALRSFERIPAVRDHDCDFAIVRRDLITPPLKSAALFPTQHRLIARRDLLAKARSTDVHQLLEKLPLALPPRGHFSHCARSGRGPHRVRLNVVISVTAFSMAARAVHTGRYAAILPHVAAVDFPPKDFAMLPVPLLGGFTQRFHLCWNPRVIRVSHAAEEAKPVLQELLAKAAG